MEVFENWVCCQSRAVCCCKFSCFKSFAKKIILSRFLYDLKRWLKINFKQKLTSSLHCLTYAWVKMSWKFIKTYAPMRRILRGNTKHVFYLRRYTSFGRHTRNTHSTFMRFEVKNFQWKRLIATKQRRDVYKTPGKSGEISFFLAFITLLTTCACRRRSSTSNTKARVLRLYQL